MSLALRIILTRCGKNFWSAKIGRMQHLTTFTECTMSGDSKVDAAVVSDALQARPQSQITFQSDGFDPWRVQPIKHRLSDHPLLQMPQLLALADRLDAMGSIRTHGNDASAGTPFNDATRLYPNTRSAAQTLANINDAKAFLSLLNVQIDPIYREFVGAVLDGVRPLLEPCDPGMCYRGGWIFVSSPHTVTPFHFDKEHNFLLQIRGKKRVYVWDANDTVVANELARDRFHHCHERKLLVWDEAFRERAQVFDLRPGEGAYMPSTSPHMVENGDQTSVTMSLTYYTDSTRRNALLHKAHAMLREKGFVPPPVGTSSFLDDGLLLLAQARRLWRRLARRGGESGTTAYAEDDR